MREKKKKRKKKKKKKKKHWNQLESPFFVISGL